MENNTFYTSSTPSLAKGIDISHHNGAIDWKRVKDDSIQFVILKATEDIDYVDPTLRKNYLGAQEVGLKIGFYHFARFNTEKQALQEAEFFYSKVKNLPCELPYMLDIEVKSGNVSWDDLSKYCRVFMDHLKDISGHTVGYYCNLDFYNHLKIKDYPLWIARYRDGNPGVSPWVFWQYSKTGHVDGIESYVDLDYCDAEYFNSLLKGEKKPTIKPVKESKKKPTNTGTYTIKKGDTFWEIEERFGYPHGSLQDLNPNIDPKRLQVGQKIKVPSNKKENQKTDNKSSTYVIKKGDTFWEIEERFGYPHGSLQKLNPNIDPKRLQVGQTIKVPSSKNKKTSTTYTIKKGDTFWDLENAFHLPHGTLAKLNPNVDPKRLKVGQKIIIKK